MKPDALDEYWAAIARLPEVHAVSLWKAVAAERADRDQALARLAELEQASAGLGEAKRATEARAIRYAAHAETNEAGQTNYMDLLSLADRIESGEVTVT